MVQLRGDRKRQSRISLAPNVLWNMWQALQEITFWVPNSHYHINCVCRDSLGLSKCPRTWCGSWEREPGRRKWVFSSPNSQLTGAVTRACLGFIFITRVTVNLVGKWLSEIFVSKNIWKYSCKQVKAGLNYIWSARHFHNKWLSNWLCIKATQGEGSGWTGWRYKLQIGSQRPFLWNWANTV